MDKRLLIGLGIIVIVCFIFNFKKGSDKKILIEVGAYDGSDSLRYYNLGYKVYTFEPHKELFKTLNNKVKNLKDFNLINKAVSDKNGVAKFNLSKGGGAHSILEFNDNKTLRRTWNKREDIEYSGESYEVETIRLDKFIEENNLETEKIDYLHIDAQGKDLDVLLSLGKYLDNVKEGVIEVSSNDNLSIYKNSNNSIDLAKKILTNNNFKIDKIESVDNILNPKNEYNILFSK